MRNEILLRVVPIVIVLVGLTLMLVGTLTEQPKHITIPEQTEDYQQEIQYKVHKTEDPHSMEPVLFNLGNEGWSLTTSYRGVAGNYYFVFKRVRD